MTKTPRQATQAGKAIKAELRKAFPDVKFSVKSKYFSMGNSVEIEWNLGITTEKVYALVDKYEYGKFNGMIDSYEYNNNRDDIPQVKYVNMRRNYLSYEDLNAEKLSFKEWDEYKKKETTLKDTIAKDICKLLNFNYEGEGMPLPKDLEWLIVPRYSNSKLCDLVTHLLEKTDFAKDGYRKVRRVIEDGQEIPNSVEIF